MSKNVMSKDELTSTREWLASWGNGPNWSDASGATVPTVKQTITRLLDTIEHWKKRAAQHGCNIVDGDHECG